MSESKLKLYSLGIVIENKQEGSDVIKVSPIEELNIQTPGLIKDFNKEYEGNKKELGPTNFKTEHEAKNYLLAKWLPFGHSNRNTAPDVVANETVILFKYANVDEYFWTTLFREPELRRQETVEYAFSNIPSGIKAFNKNTSYWLEVSTRHKYIHLHTSKNDGEKVTYDIIIDTKGGSITIKDDRKNSITLNSVGDTITINTGNEVTINAKNVVNVKSPTINLDGNVNISGRVRVKGGSSRGSSMNISGNIDINGNINTNGNINATGSIIDAGGNTNHHSH